MTNGGVCGVTSRPRTFALLEGHSVRTVHRLGKNLVVGLDNDAISSFTWG